MSWGEMDGAEWKQMKLNGGRWSWVEMGAQFSNIQNKSMQSFDPLMGKQQRDQWCALSKGMKIVIK